MDDLMKAAADARRKAYAPYSRYAVGAAVRSGQQALTVGGNGNAGGNAAVFPNTDSAKTRRMIPRKV